MAVRGVIYLLPLVAFAQTPAPPDVDRALRASLTEFYQDFVDGKFRQAMDLVAEDTQEEYFASSKTPIKGFEIRTIKYSADFTKADVTVQVKREWRLPAAMIGPAGTQAPIVDVPINTMWKIERGKWVWTHEIKPDTWITPMGPSNVELIKRNSDGAVTGVPHGITPDKVSAAALQILKPGGLDKSEVVLSATKFSSEKVVFHNAAQGSIQLEMSAPSLPGLTVKLDKTDLNLGEDATIQVGFDPPVDVTTPAPRTAMVHLNVVPFNQGFDLKISFDSPKK